MKRAKLFQKETDLCSAFIKALPDGWIAYAETAGYDILLSRSIDGFQIGIQAKLKLNPFVLAQALEEQYHVVSPAPDARAVLIPADEISIGVGYLCAWVGVTIIRMEASPEDAKKRHGWGRGIKMFAPELPERGKWSEREWYEQCPTKRCKLPDYIPDVAAGAPSPLQLTDWKVRAIKIAVLLELRGHVTRNDFRAINIDHRLWISPGQGWLTPRDGRYVPGPRMPNFREQHPVVFETIKADAPRWMPKEAEPIQPVLKL